MTVLQGTPISFDELIGFSKLQSLLSLVVDQLNQQESTLQRLLERDSLLEQKVEAVAADGAALRGLVESLQQDAPAPAEAWEGCSRQLEELQGGLARLEGSLEPQVRALELRCAAQEAEAVTWATALERVEERLSELQRQQAAPRAAELQALLSQERAAQLLAEEVAEESLLPEESPEAGMEQAATASGSPLLPASSEHSYASSEFESDDPDLGTEEPLPKPSEPSASGFAEEARSDAASSPARPAQPPAAEAASEELGEEPLLPPEEALEEEEEDPLEDPFEDPLTAGVEVSSTSTAWAQESSPALLAGRHSDIPPPVPSRQVHARHGGGASSSSAPRPSSHVPPKAEQPRAPPPLLCGYHSEGSASLESENVSEDGDVDVDVASSLDEMVMSPTRDADRVAQPTSEAPPVSQPDSRPPTNRGAASPLPRFQPPGRAWAPPQGLPDAASPSGRRKDGSHAGAAASAVAAAMVAARTGATEAAATQQQRQRLSHPEPSWPGSPGSSLGGSSSFVSDVISASPSASASFEA